MAYIFKEKLTISDLVAIPTTRRLVLVLESEEYLVRLYRKILLEHGFAVEHSSQVTRAVELVSAFAPHLLLLNPQIRRGFSDAKLVRSVTATFPHLPVVTVGFEQSPEELKQLMDLGVASHINRALTRPHDIVAVVRTILQ